MAKWNPGDKVKLNTGGPEMSVQVHGFNTFVPIGSTVAQTREIVICSWFVGDDLRQAEFAPESLEAVK